MNNSHHQTTTDTNSASADPFLLDWGSSLNVNEDLRRTIQTEISQIDKDLKSLDASIRTEQKVASQSHKDVSYAQAELMHLARGAGDEEGNASLSESIQGRLGDSLEKEVLGMILREQEKNYNGSDDRSHTCSDSHDDSHCDYNNSRKGNKSNNSNNSNNSNDDIATRIQQFRSLKNAITNKQSSIHTHQAKAQEVQYLLHNANARINREQKNKSTWEDDKADKLKENQGEKERLKGAKEAIYRARRNTGEFTKQRTDYLNELGSAKKMNQSQEQNLQALLSTQQNNTIKLAQTVNEITNALAHKSNHLATLQQQLQEQASIERQCQDIQNKIQESNVQTEDMTARYNDTRSKLSQQTQDLHRLQRDLQNRQLCLKDLQEKLIRGETERIQKVEPARIELPILLQETEEMVRNIESYQEKLVQVQTSGGEDVALIQKSLEEVRHTLIDKRGEKKELLDNLVSLKETHRVDLESIKEECDQQNVLLSRYEEAKFAEEKLMKELSEQRSKEQQERRDFQEQEIVEEVVKKDLLICGVEVIRETERLEQEYKTRALAIEA